MDVSAKISSTLKGSDLIGKTVIVTVHAVTEETFGGKNTDAEQKVCLGFVGAKKKLPLNKTNLCMMAALFGTETDKWIGRKVELHTEKVTYGGKVFDGVVLRQAPGAGVAVVPETVQDAWTATNTPDF